MCSLTMFSPEDVLENALEELAKGNLREYYKLYKMYKEMTDYKPARES